MRSLRRTLLAAALLLLTSLAAKAQAQSAACGPGQRQFAWMIVATGSGCPFSGTIDTARVKTLRDGTHVQTDEKNLIYRNSLGIIRYQTYVKQEIDNKQTEALVFDQIIDPVAGFMYVLQWQTRVARRSKLRPQAMNSAADAQSRNSRGGPSGSAPAQKARLRPLIENLGTQQMEGLAVVGVRTTRTIPADSEGNDARITTVSDVWTSPELGVSILHKVSDPRAGEIVSRMTNVQRLEPDPALFRLAADYRIEDW